MSESECAIKCRCGSAENSILIPIPLEAAVLAGNIFEGENVHKLGGHYNFAGKITFVGYLILHRRYESCPPKCVCVWGGGEWELSVLKP